MRVFVAEIDKPERIDQYYQPSEATFPGIFGNNKYFYAWSNIRSIVSGQFELCVVGIFNQDLSVPILNAF